MLFDVISGEYLEGYKVRLSFENGTSGVVDLSEYCSKGGVFSSFSNISFFRQFTINPDIGTISWPNGADIAPETLYQKIAESTV